MVEKNTGNKNFLKGIRMSRLAIETFDRLFAATPPRELRENLEEIYHMYMVYAYQLLPADFEKLALNMYLLIGTLESIDKEMNVKS
jgi:hypothetical protein